jgi:hypothetical protein
MTIVHPRRYVVAAARPLNVDFRRMGNWFLVVFALSLAYAVLGNVAVYLMLPHRGTAINSFWVGVPGYLYKFTVAGTGLRRFALSTNVAFLIAIVCGMFLAGERS